MLQPAVIGHDDQREYECSVCHAPLPVSEVHYGHPLITARQIVSMAISTAVRSPRIFREVMLIELPPAPYCAECRRALPAKRQAEQFKFLIGLLFVLVAIMVLVWGVPAFF